MQTRLKMSHEGLGLLKEFEGLRLNAAQLPDGRWTMGHGHTQYAREGATITAADAEDLLVYDLIPVVAAVNEAVVPQISQNQFDALVCFAFNVGVEEFRASEVLQRVNQERMTEAALAMAIWRAGAFGGRRIVLDALVRRRTAEEAMLLGRDGAQSPSNLVRPVVDETARASLPESRPALVEVDQAGDTAEAALVQPDAGVSSAEAAPIVPFAVATEAAVVEVQPEVEAGVGQEDDEAVEDDRNAGASLEAAIDGGPETTSGLAAATVSTRVEASYPERFSSVASAPEEMGEANPGDAEAPALEEPAPETGAETETNADPETLQALVLTPPPEVASEPPTAPETLQSPPVEATEPAQAQPPLFEEAADGSNSGGEPVIYYESTGVEGEGAARWSDTGAYIATGAVGLAAFGFGIAGFHLAGQDPIALGMFDEKTVISWVLVAIGVICVWIAAYNLFKRLGGPEPA